MNCDCDDEKTMHIVLCVVLCICFILCDIAFLCGDDGWEIMESFSICGCIKVIVFATLVAIAVCLFFLLADSFWGDKTKLLSSDGSIVLVRNKCGVSKTSFNSDIRVAYIASGNTIEKNEFLGCCSLEIVKFHPGVKNIGPYAFAGCERLNSGGLEFPSELDKIGEGAFLGCKRLEKIELPENVKSIGKYAFAECSGLEMVTIGKSCTNIGENAFKGCKQITLKFLDNESVQKLGLKDNYSKWGLNKNCKIQFPNGSSMSIEDFIKFVQ